MRGTRSSNSTTPEPRAEIIHLLQHVYNPCQVQERLLTIDYDLRPSSLSSKTYYLNNPQNTFRAEEVYVQYHFILHS